MKATLIFPGIVGLGFDRGYDPIPEATFMPHGLALIAASAQQRGHAIDVLDLRCQTGWRGFTKAIQASASQVFGISAMSSDYGMAVRCARIIRKTHPRAAIVIGGVHPTVAPEEVLSNTVFDHVVCGEGEEAFADLLEAYERGERPERLIQGPSPDYARLPWASRLPFDYARRELLVPWLPHMPAPSVTVITSRGCPFNCSFCQPAERRIFGGKVRVRPVEDVIAELEDLRERYRFKSFLIHDDLFVCNPDYVRRFLELYREKGFDQSFVCQARADIICKHEDTIRLLAEHGLSCLMIGFESGSQRILDLIRKGTTVEQNRQAAAICRKYGIRIFANYMFGLPSETVEEMFATAEMIKEIAPDYPSPTFFTPTPGSDLFDFCQQEGLSKIRDYRDFRRNPTHGKIRGVDYRKARKALALSTSYRPPRPSRLLLSRLRALLLR